jgi:hypothetical protein
VVAVQHVWVEIDAIRPVDRSRYIVDHDLSEDARIPKGFEDSALECSIQVHLSDEAVGKSHTEAEIPKVLDLDNPGHLAHQIQPTEGVDREKRLGICARSQSSMSSPRRSAVHSRTRHPSSLCVEHIAGTDDARTVPPWSECSGEGSFGAPAGAVARGYDPRGDDLHEVAHGVIDSLLHG